MNRPIEDWQWRIAKAVIAGRLQDEETRADALTAFWLEWDRSSQLTSVRRVALRAVAQIARGQRRKLAAPCLHHTDALQGGRAWQGGAMDGLADRAKGPQYLAELRDLISAFAAHAGERAGEIVRMRLAGHTWGEIASRYRTGKTFLREHLQGCARRFFLERENGE